MAALCGVHACPIDTIVHGRPLVVAVRLMYSTQPRPTRGLHERGLVSGTACRIQGLEGVYAVCPQVPGALGRWPRGQGCLRTRRRRRHRPEAVIAQAAARLQGSDRQNAGQVSPEKDSTPPGINNSAWRGMLVDGGLKRLLRREASAGVGDLPTFAKAESLLA